jgi:hypothetical protein
MISYLRIIILCVVVGLLLSFCFFNYLYSKGVESVEDMEVVILDISFSEVKVSSCVLGVLVNISNPSDYYFSGVSSVFDIFIDDNVIGSGSFSELDIPAFSSRVVEIPVTIMYLGLAQGVVELVTDFLMGNPTSLFFSGDLSIRIFFGFMTITRSFSSLYFSSSI